MVSVLPLPAIAFPKVATEMPKNHSLSVIVDASLETNMNNEKRVTQETKVVQMLWPLKLPLPSQNAILCMSSDYILSSEIIKRKNHLILFDEHQKKSMIRSPIKDRIRQTIWVEELGIFLLLTEKLIWFFKPSTKEIKVVSEIKALGKKSFKSFALLNLSILIVCYDEWNPKLLDRWQFDTSLNLWRVISPLQITTVPEEFIGYMTADLQDGENGYFLMPIYNDTSNTWRIEFRNSLTLHCMKVIRLQKYHTVEDLKILPIHNRESSVSWLMYFSNTDVIIGLKEDWKVVALNCGLQIQQLGIFKRKYLSFRTNTQLMIQLIT